MGWNAFWKQRKAGRMMVKALDKPEGNDYSIKKGNDKEEYVLPPVREFRPGCAGLRGGYGKGYGR